MLTSHDDKNYFQEGVTGVAERILVVDDKIEIANLIEVYLKNENYEVLKCYTADEAV